MSAWWNCGVFLAITTIVFTAGCTPSPQPAAEKPSGTAGEQDNGGVVLNDLPSILSQKYRADPYIRAAAQLQEMGKEKAIAALSALATRRYGDPSYADDVAKVVCRLLFVGRPGHEFRGPGLGEAEFLGRTDFTDWPLAPMEVVDGVPFCIVQGYNLGGRAEHASAYLQYCIRECDWGSQVYIPKSGPEKQAALAKLLTSPKWKGRLDAQDRAYLEAQIK